jgi:hypothetical protein
MRLVWALALSLVAAPSPSPQERIDRLAAELGSETVEVRKKATRDLVASGKPALKTIKKLAVSAKDAEMRSRAVRIVNEIEVALRPKVIASFLFGKQEKAPTDAWKGEAWIRKAAADQGYENLSAPYSLEGSEISDKRRVLYPEKPSEQPGGLYIRGQITEQTPDMAVIEISCSIKSMKSGRFVLKSEEPRKLIRLTDQPGLGDLFIALQLRSRTESPEKMEKK